MKDNFDLKKYLVENRLTETDFGKDIEDYINKSKIDDKKAKMFQVYDTNDDEVLFEGSKKQILDWMWENFSNGMMGIEINQI
jgi:hypothetical protein